MISARGSGALGARGTLRGSACHGLQSSDGCDQGKEEEESPEIRGLLEEHDTDDRGAHSPDARPYGVGCADGQRARGEVEQVHAGAQAEEEADHPPRRFMPGCGARLAQTSGEAYLEEPCDDEPTFRTKKCAE